MTALSVALSLIVTVALFAHTIGGTVLTSPTNRKGIELSISKQLVLQCNSTTQSKLKRWLKDEVDIALIPGRKDHKPLKNRILWDKDGDPNTVTLKNNDRQFEKNLTGKYRCEFEDGESSEFDVQAKPHLTIESDGVKLSSTSINVVEGDRVALVCKVQKDKGTELLGIAWYKNFEDPDGKDNYNMVGTDDNRIKVIPLDSNEEATMTIASASFDDRAKYMCQVTYGDRKASAYIFIRVKDKLAALWPFLGIVGEVIILCAVIFIYEKRRNKGDFEESETDNAADSGKSPTTAAKGQEVRQRK